jgi:membrane fusion protein (multidrug efflux system)
MESDLSQSGHRASRNMDVSSRTRDSWKRPFRFSVFFLFAVGLLSSAGCKKNEQGNPGAQDVQVVEVVQQDVPITQKWVATLTGYINAQIRAQVTGYLLRQMYSNGALVSKGSPLFQIDPRPYRAALDQAKGNLQQAKADLQQAQARLGKTELDVARFTPLAKESAISQQELDDAVQADLAAKAQVEAAKAAISSAEAAQETAQLNLGFTSVDSPIAGVAGIAGAQVGDFVGPQSAPLTTVSTVDPILANFTASESEYLSVARQVAISQDKPNLSFDQTLGKMQWTLILADGTTFPHKGRLCAVDRQVDIRTGSILVQIQFPNPGNVLRPGGFGSISSVVRVQQGALVVPQRAVTELQGRYLVATVGTDNRVSVKPVKVGARVGSMWIVDEGLKSGERIVAEGIQKVRDGSVVNPTPYQPGAVSPASSGRPGGSN